jgi:hypothetical protein
MQRSGVWVAVLLIHVFLWIALAKGREAPTSRQNAFTYLSVVQIVLNHPSTRTPQWIKDSPSDVSKVSTSSKMISVKQPVIRGVEISERKIATPEIYIKNKRAKELANADEISVLQKPPSHLINDGSAKQIVMLDYDAMKRIALSIAHESENRILPGIDKKLSGSQKIAKIIDDGKRSDCRSAYAYLELPAILFLLRDTILDSGCKW